MDGSDRRVLRATVPNRVSETEWTPLRITVVYLAFGFGALLASDVLLVRLVRNPLLARVQIVKGALEVVVTGGLIFALARASRASLRRKTDQLQRQREELDVLHRVLRHNLRNTLTVLNGRVAYLRRECIDSDRGTELCDRIDEVAEEIGAYVERASRIRRVTETGDRSVTFDVTDAISDLLAGHARVTGATSVRTNLPDRATVRANAMFEAVLAELVTNAIKHNDSEEPRLDISVARVADAGQVVVRIADDGPGVPDRVREVIESGELDQLRHIDGMGLWFAYWVVTDSDGTFEITSNGWGGTTIRLQVASAPAGAEAGVSSPSRTELVA